MPRPLLPAREWPVVIVFTVGLAMLFAFGFIPTAHSAMEWIGHHLAPLPAGAQLLAFPLLSAAFYVSLPRPRSQPAQGRVGVGGVLVPCLISFFFGLVKGHPRLARALSTPAGREDLFWYIVAIPVGEELLFRGWLYHVIERRWPHLATATNPLPVAVWMTALAFSLWHLQNIPRDGLGATLFQVAYTFFAGLWLGYLRWKTGKVALPAAAHAALNLACNLP